MKADLVIKNGTLVTPENTFDGGVAIHDEKFVAIGTNDSVKGMPVVTIVRGHVQMRDGQPVGEAVGRMVYPVPD